MLIYVKGIFLKRHLNVTLYLEIDFFFYIILKHVSKSILSKTLKLKQKGLLSIILKK